MRIRRFRLAPIATALAAMALAVAGALHAQEAKALGEKLAALREAAADRDLQEAEKLYAEFERLGPGADAHDEARLLLGKTRLLAGRSAEASAIVDPAVAREASPWSVKSLYLQAEAAARRREWSGAADVYARRVEWAASELHRAEIATLHREIADGAFEGDIVRDSFGREKRVPDWNTALVRYRRARELHPEAKDAALISYRIGKAALETGDAEGARAEWAALRERGAGEWADDALYGIGLAYQRLGRNADARAAFQRVREEAADGPFAPLALIRIGETWNPLVTRSEEELARTIGAWREFLRLHPSHAEAADVAWRIGDTLQGFGKMKEAAEAFRAFVASFPQHERAPLAQDRVARALLALGDFDGAIAEWRVLLDRWPSHELWTQAQRAIVEAAFAKGRVAFDEKRDEDARASLEAFLAQHPADAHAGEAQRLLGDLLARQGKHAEAVVAWRLVTTKYPDHLPAAPIAALAIASAFEGPLADLEKALTAYEEVVSRWPQSGEARLARNVLTQMKGKTLEFRIARPFRTDEEPAAAVTLRNVSRLRLKAYRVRLDEYLRRKGGLAGVEKVEVDVVKPDHEWDWTPPDSARYRLLERTCPLPLPKPGAYVVTASEEELTATFLVVISDLTVIAKAAANQGLVFVWDERSGKPVQGARVALLDGGEGVTDETGVWRKDDLGHGQVRAIVTGQGPHAGHFAFAAGASPGVAAFGYSTKVFLQSDRPVYRPGQSVHLRGIVRRVESGRYVTEEGLIVRLRVVDPRGALLVDEEVKTDAYGIVARSLELAGEPSLGTYAVQAEVDQRTFAQSFDVLAYRKPDVLADVVPEKRAYLAGDPVKATVSLRFAVGGVVAGAPVRWTVWRGPFVFDPSVHEAFSWFFRDAAREAELQRRRDEGGELFTRGEGVTDAHGKLEIAFTTEAVDVDRTYLVAVEAQDPNRQWIRTSASVPVTTRGVHVLCRTEKKVYRPGEVLKLEVTTVDPLHVPVAVEGRAVLVRRRLQDQHFVDEEVASVAAKTGDDGRAVVDLTATKPGEHLARFVAKDARGNEVSGAAAVTISGDAEDLARQARLVADREFYREGDVAKVFVNVPVAPAPVLLTYEGERVLEHRIVFATERAQTIDVPLRAEHAPNVFLRMAVAKGGMLYEDGDEVAVFRYLDVKVTADPSDTRPGGKVKLRVVTTDQSGNPVQAEVGVDVVDAAIYQIAPDATPQVKPFFYDQRRTHGVATYASVGALPSVTLPTNKDLLFEQMRRLGKAKFEEMEEYVRLGRELLQRGETAKAAEELRKALEIAPGNYEARALLVQLDDARRLREDKAANPPAPQTAAPAKAPGAPDDSESKEAPRRGAGAHAVGGPSTGAGDAAIGGAFGSRGGGKRRRAADEKKLKDESADLDAADKPMEESERSVVFESHAGFRWRAEGLFDRGLVNGVLLLADAPSLLPAELRTNFADTAHAALARTGEDGTTTVEIDLPDNLTEWKVNARGASRGPLVGEGSTRFRTSKKLLVRPDAPRFLVQGDRTTPTGTLHSSLDSESEVTLRFAATGANVTEGGERKVTLRPGEVRPFDAKLESPAHGLATLRVDALTSVESDAAQLGLPVLPYGVRHLDGASGLLVEEGFAVLDLPERAVPGTASLTVTLSPSIDVALLESLAYTGGYPWGCVEQTVNRFLPALAARRALGDAGSWNERLKKALDDVTDRGLAALYAMQNDDGSFGWFGARAAHDPSRAAGTPEMTAYAVLGFVRAEQAGRRVSAPNRDRAVNAARNLVRGASAEDRAFLLYALSIAGQADLEALNALHRERSTLRPRGLALLALAMQQSGRPSNALELARLLASKAVREDGGAHWEPDLVRMKAARIPLPPRDAEPTAYALLALLAADPQNPLVDEAAAWLAGARRGPAWRSTRDTAAAIEALAEHARSRGVARAEGDVAVYVNDAPEPVATIRFGGSARPVDAPSSVEIPPAVLRPGRNKLTLRRQGPGRVHWSALLAAVEAPAEGQRIEKASVLLSVERETTEWFRPRIEGEPVEERIVPGWSVVVAEKRPVWSGRPLRAAATGEKVRVTLTVSSPEPVTHVIVEDALPAGCEVVTGSAQGPFDREERRDDRQAFFLARVHGRVRLTYVLQAVHPGEYRVLPANVRAMYEPELHGRTSEERFTVAADPSARSGPSPEEITPDEVWALALRAFARREWDAARQGLEQLRTQYELLPEIQEELWARLFAIGVETNDAKLTASAFEQVTDRNPRRAPADVRTRRALADAYRSLGEHERATVLYRDLVRDLFAIDREGAEAFAAIGNPWRSRDLQLAMLRRMPDAGWVEDEEMKLARATAQMRAPLPAAAGARRPEASDLQPLLLDEAVRMFRAFQAQHAASPLAHEAGFLAVQTLVRMKLSADAVREGTRFLARHVASPYLDDVTYLVAEGHFQAGAHDEALSVANTLLTEKFPSDADPRVKTDSPFRSQAIHLAAKVAHLRGDLPGAVDLYRKVAGLFPDAADAERFLTEKGLQLRDVETSPVGGTPVLHMRRKNVPEVQLEVYAVDFMILYALRRNLADVHRIDLSGIEPVKRWSVARRGPEDFRWGDEEVQLPAKEKGVYLVTARGEGLFASSVVLVSDLQVDVQEAGGRLRVYTTNRTTGAPWGDVYVKVGNGAAIQAQGFSDARGVLDVPAVKGGFSVVAEKDGNVALWRR